MDWNRIKDEICTYISFRDIINKYTNYEVKNDRTCCINPLCRGNQEHTMSIKKNFGYCFRCAKNFGVINGVQTLFDIDFVPAVKKIIEDFNLPISLDTRLSPEERKAFLEKQLEIEKQKARRDNAQRFEKKTRFAIVDKLRELDKILCNRETTTEDSISLFKEKDRLEWLYDKISGCDTKECEYEYLYPYPPVDVLRLIFLGKIKI